jgi:hypothetical protein
MRGEFDAPGQKQIVGVDTLALLVHIKRFSGSIISIKTG